MSLNLVQAWTQARRRLEAAGIASPVIDARLLLEAAADATRADIVGDPYREVAPEQAARLEDYLARRIRREPVSHILGRKGFWKIMLQVTPDVLTPRPDTETVVEYVLRDFPEHAPWSVLDLGVGSGAILLAILAERPAAKGLGVDVSEEALAVARENAANLGLAGRVALLRGDWTQGLAADSFDLVVSNPPYIADPVLATLEPEVRDHEPRLALSGGPDGLDAYRTLAPEILRVLRPGGRFAVEIGYDQRQAVEALFRQAGAAEVVTLRDLGDQDRVVAGLKKPLETGR
jgi:release factor glutamine methyltransferase